MTAETSITPRIEPRRVDVLTAAPSPLPFLQTPRHSLWFCTLPALASALLLWMCYFPLAWGWLGWVALVPFLSLVRAQASPRRLFFCAYLCGSAFFWPAIQWMRVADYRMYATWAMLAVYCSLYFPVALSLIRLLDRRTFLPLVLSVPIVWTALEFVRSFMLTGFAWYYLGHTQHTFLSVIQIADLGGVYLISFLIAAVNAWLFDLLYQIPNLRGMFRWDEPRRRDDQPLYRNAQMRRGLIYELGVVFLALVGTMIYGAWRLSQNTFEPGPIVTLLQTNIDQRIRMEATDPENRTKANVELVRQYEALCKKAIDFHPKTDLIVWPETSFPFPWLNSSPKLPIQKVPDFFRQGELEVRQHLQNDLLKSHPTNHLLGMNSFILGEDGVEKHYNSALMLREDGVFAERFDKMHRVPFGEYVPFRDWYLIGPVMNWLAPYDTDYSIRIGEKFTRFNLAGHKFGTLICYEDTDPFLARRYVRTDDDGPPVDFLINMSNDGWFDGTSEHDEHLAISRFRAIECRRALARSVNMGISAVIDGNGRVMGVTELPPVEEPHFWLAEEHGQALTVDAWSRFKKTPGILRVRIPLDTRASFYAQSGDWLPCGCWAIVGATFGWSLIRRRKHSMTTRAA